MLIFYLNCLRRKIMRVVIIGGGTAGVSVATHLRRKDENAEIIILEKSDEFAISSCGLPYILSNTLNAKDDIIGATVAQMQRIFQIDVKLNTEVLTIKPETKQITLANKNTLSYDKLVIATGALQLRPDIKGILAGNIFSLNSLLSAQRINDYFKGLDAQNILVLGGGFIGLRTAEALTNSNTKVNVIDSASHILSDFDYDFATMIKQKISSSRVSFYTNTSVNEFASKKAFLSNGETINYDMAVISTGIKPLVKLPILSDIELSETGGIKVNEYLQTNIEDIYACGENIEIKNSISNKEMKINDASLVVRSAKVVAENIAGIKTKFTHALRNYIIKVFGYTIGICGCNEEELKSADIPYYKLYFSQSNGEIYLKSSSFINAKLLFGHDGKILGAQLMGKKGIDKRLNIIASIINHNGKIDELADFVMAYFPEFSKAKDMINNMGTLSQEILNNELKTLALDDLVKDDILLNVCMPSSVKYFTKAHIMHLPLAAIRSNLSEISRNKRVILACTTGYTAYIAYCLLRQRGFNKLYLLNSEEVWK